MCPLRRSDHETYDSDNERSRINHDPSGSTGDAPRSNLARKICKRARVPVVQRRRPPRSKPDLPRVEIRGDGDPHESSPRADSEGPSRRPRGPLDPALPSPRPSTTLPSAATPPLEETSAVFRGNRRFCAREGLVMLEGGGGRVRGDRASRTRGTQREIEGNPGCERRGGSHFVRGGPSWPRGPLVEHRHFGVELLRDRAREPRAGARSLRACSKSLREGATEPRGGSKALREGTAERRGGTRLRREGATEPCGGSKALREGTAERRGGTRLRREGATEPRGGRSRSASAQRSCGRAQLRRGLGSHGQGERRVPRRRWPRRRGVRDRRPPRGSPEAGTAPRTNRGPARIPSWTCVWKVSGAWCGARAGARRGACGARRGDGVARQPAGAPAVRGVGTGSRGR